LAVDEAVGEPVDLGKALDRELLQGVIFRLAKAGDEAGQVSGRHHLIAQQDGAVAMEGRDDLLQCRLVRAPQVDIQNLRAEAWLEGAGADLDRCVHVRCSDKARPERLASTTRSQGNGLAPVRPLICAPSEALFAN
jgi:hypothetical protein